MCRTRHTCQTRRHSPSRVAQTRQTRERRVWQVLRKFSECGESGKFGECRLDHFMHITNVICAKNDLSYHARQTRRHSPSRVAQIRQTRERRVWQVLREFSKSGEFGKCRLDHFMHITNVICAKNDLSYHARLLQRSPRGLASTRQTR